MSDEVPITGRKTMLEYLPAIYQESDPPEGRPLRNFLAAFERILLGYEEGIPRLREGRGKG